MIGLFILFPKVKEELAKYVSAINAVTQYMKYIEEIPPEHRHSDYFAEWLAIKGFDNLAEYDHLSGEYYLKWQMQEVLEDIGLIE